MQPTNKEIDKLKRHDNCLKCGQDLSNKLGWKYCSRRCSKLYLKAAYKRRNAEKIREYNKEYRNKAVDSYFVRSRGQREYLMALMPRCQKCNTKVGLQLCHIKPHWAGGTIDLHNFIVLCRVCHHAFDNMMRVFWNAPVDPVSVEIYRAKINDDMLLEQQKAAD